MPLLLVRHAVALRRHDWSQPDHLRCLTPKGYAQAGALVEVLSEFSITRILSSPFIRCVETIEPLALHLGLPIESLPALAEGAGDAASHLELAGGDGAVVLCSHGDVIPELLGVLAPAAMREVRVFRCAKGSTWVVEGTPAGPTARYIDPPEVV